MNYFDGLLVMLIILGMWRGYTKGIVTLIAGIVGRIITLVLALMLARPVALWIGPSFGVLDWLTINLIERFPTAKAMAGADMGRVTAQKLPDVLDSMGLPPLLKFKVMEQAPELLSSGSASVTAIIQELAAQTAFLLLQAFTFLILLALGGLLIRLLVSLVDHAFAKTILGSLNRLLGTALSLSLVLVVLVMAIGLTAPLILAPASGEPGSLATLFKSSYLYPRFLEAYGLLIGALISR